MKKFLILFIALSTLLTGCKGRVDETQYVVLKEVVTEVEHYQLVSSMDHIYLVNVKTDSIAKLKRRNGELLPALRLYEDVTTELSLVSVDPLMSGLGFEEDIPNTYIGTEEDISIYLRALYNGGYKLKYAVSTNEYIDIVIELEGVTHRIVVLPTVFKVFENVEVKSIDAATYINEI